MENKRITREETIEERNHREHSNKLARERYAKNPEQFKERNKRYELSPHGKEARKKKQAKYKVEHQSEIKKCSLEHSIRRTIQRNIIRENKLKAIKNNPNEIWKEIPHFPQYEVSNYGRVINLTNPRIKSPSLGNRGYPMVGLVHPTLKNKRGQFLTRRKLLHRIIAIAFIPNPENKPQVNHKDGNKENYILSNLEWSTSSENIQHAYDTGLLVQKNRSNDLT